MVRQSQSLGTPIEPKFRKERASKIKASLEFASLVKGSFWFYCSMLYSKRYYNLREHAFSGS
jgi:hypothetical protein